MADSDQKIKFHDDLFDLGPIEIMPNNHRKTIRYLRNDIKISLVYSNALGLKKTVATELHDISSRGALVATPYKLGFVKKVTVVITFKDSRVFRISGRIVRKCPHTPFCYGIKFEKQENALGDYLLKTQTDLIFK